MRNDKDAGENRLYLYGDYDETDIVTYLPYGLIDQFTDEQLAHVKPSIVASWLELMSPRVKAGDAWNEMKLALSAMGVNIETKEEYFSPAVGE